MPANALLTVNKKIKYSKKILGDITALVKNPAARSCFPERGIKSRVAIMRDIIFWLVRHGEVNRFYYLYGLDSKDNSRAKDVMSYRTFRGLRDKASIKLNRGTINYNALLRDKFIFGQMLSSLKYPTPKNIAFLKPGEITWLENMKTVPISEIGIDTTITVDGFCKPLSGTQGDGAFSLRLSNGKIYIRGKEASAEELQSRIKGSYLLQERVIQHPVMSRLHPASLNSIRMVTFNIGGNIEIFTAALRIGTDNRNIDNWAAGGIAIGIDLETGTLKDEGFYKPAYGGRVLVHPDTGITLKGYQLPFFEEAKELCSKLHKYFYGIHSIGWDIGMTENGPVLIEGNEDWDGSIPMAVEKNFRQRYLEMLAR